MLKKCEGRSSNFCSYGKMYKMHSISLYFIVHLLHVFADLPQVRAIEDYEATQEDELTFQEGNVINVHKKMSDGELYTMSLALAK